MKYLFFCLLSLMVFLPGGAHAETLSGGGYSLVVNIDAPQGSYSGNGYSGVFQTALTSQSYYSSDSVFIVTGALPGILQTNFITAQNLASVGRTSGYLNHNIATKKNAPLSCYDDLILKYGMRDYSAMQGMKRVLVAGRYITWLAGRKRVQNEAQVFIKDSPTNNKKVRALNYCPKYYNYMTNI